MTIVRWAGMRPRRWLIGAGAVAALAAALVVAFARPSGSLGTWTDESGHEVASDVVAVYPGSEHCGWGDADILRLASHVMQGHGLAGPQTYFVRDPSGAIEATTLTDYDGQAELPDHAVDTGFTTDSVHLWLHPEGRAVYLVFADGVERWPRVDGVLMCG